MLLATFLGNFFSSPPLLFLLLSSLPQAKCM